MKRILKKALFEIAKYILISCLIYGCVFAVHELTGFDSFDLHAYAQKHSEVSSQASVELYRPANHTDYGFLISTDEGSDNELWVFEKTDNALFSFFGFSGHFKKTPYLHISSSQSISGVRLDLYTSGKVFDIMDTVLVYYSANKDSAALCKYTTKNDEGYIEETEVKLNPYGPFLLLIPCTRNYRQWKYEVLSVSFYDYNNKLIHEDINP